MLLSGKGATFDVCQKVVGARATDRTLFRYFCKANSAITEDLLSKGEGD